MRLKSSMMKSAKSGIFSGILFVSTSITSIAAPLPLPDTPYNYTVLDQELPNALQEFGSNLNLKVNVSSEVKGRIRGRMPELRPREFLDHLAKLYNLQWYFDGLVLYVTAAKEAQSRLLVLAPISFVAFRDTLDALNISDERFVVRPAPGNGLVLTSGPPRFITLAEQILSGLVAEAQARPRAIDVQRPPRDTVLMLFRGTSAAVIRNGRLEGQYSADAPRPEGIVRAPALEPR
ncbi:nodulation protein NolW [Bosea sp. (in: a-proteobacteria)]|jgi:type II secretory pathway component GspD/PulD (secretin)|uniref:nodulation protein NolW n=1 Tax=Bosea sp. (in: a-proteobacteria) TaxID=1871050 RepID=UPI003F7037CE